MAVNVAQFSAKDAFTYVDTYRRAVKLSAATITTEKERLKERARRGTGFGSNYYAELRALEHAMNFVVKNEEPRRVVLGDVDSVNEGGEELEAKLNARIEELQSALNNEKMDKEKLKKDLKSVGDAYGQLQIETMELRKIRLRLQRKLAQTSSTFGVVGFAMFVVIIVLLVIVSK